ncbi:MAG: GNAT family N-acetyltransferase [Anaerolineae bacterium]
MTAQMLAPVTSRPFRDEADFWRIRDLLIETYPLTPPGFNWEIRRWDGGRFHREEQDQLNGWAESVRLWETAEGRLVGAVHPEGRGDAHLQLHPDYRPVEPEMLAWAEEHLAAPVEGSDRRQLEISVFEYDSPRRRLLAERGWEKMAYGGVFRRLRLGNRPLAQPVVARGYRMRTTRRGDGGDCQRIADVLNAGFGRTFHTAAEYRSFVAHSPSFRHELNLVAEAGDGSFACHVGVTYDEANHCGIFEPVCTVPEHRRKGLARGLMLEGLQRLKALGATDAYVGTGQGMLANELYEAVGFTEAYYNYCWRRSF